MGMYRSLVRPVAFLADAETMHNASIRIAEMASRSALARRAVAAMYVRDYERLRCSVAGLAFRNPLGLAAGYDKNGRAAAFWESLGFGHVEIGSVSAEASVGNPRPRLWRIPENDGLIVNYGLPNEGADRVAARLSASAGSVPVGVNLVHTNRGPGACPVTRDAIIDDYIRSIRRLDADAAYLMLNLSCPNTPEGRDFVSGAGQVRLLLEAVTEATPTKPVFLKVAPFPSLKALEAFLEQVDAFPVVRGFGINLAPGKPLPLRLPNSRLQSMPGAVSGVACRDIMDRAITELYERMDRRRYALIATGGVFSAADAYRKIRLGASLVQLLTALVYEGPAVIRRIAAGLNELLARDGFSTVADATGCGAFSHARRGPSGLYHN